MANSIQCRLAFLVTPKPGFLQALGLRDGHEIGRPWTVITPIRDYEDAFEGWKRAWLEKAKQDFLVEFVSTWSEDFPAFTVELRQPESFNRWWSISEIEVVEIESAWKPSRL